MRARFSRLLSLIYFLLFIAALCFRGAAQAICILLLVGAIALAILAGMIAWVWKGFE